MGGDIFCLVVVMVCFWYFCLDIDFDFFMVMAHNYKLNDRVKDNFKEVKPWFAISPLLLLILGILYINHISKGNFSETYSALQQDWFLSLNGILSQTPGLQHNITQLGDVIIFFPLISIFIIYAPKLWESLLTSSILSGLVSVVMKKLFAIPRPASVYDNESFTIIGQKLIGNHSFPSGHSIATFVIITVLLYAFMPSRKIRRFFWIIPVILVGLIIAFSRVGVGAHYPLDVVAGSLIGYIVSVIGISINNQTNWLKSIHTKKYKTVTAVIILIWMGLIIPKIIATNLVIFYVALFSLIITLYLILKSYVPEGNKTNSSISNH